MSTKGYYNSSFDLEEWKLKHKLIAKSIQEKGDFDLEEINKKVKEYRENGVDKDTY